MRRSGARRSSMKRALRGSWLETNARGTSRCDQAAAKSTTAGTGTKSSSSQHSSAASAPIPHPNSCSASCKADSTGRFPVMTSVQAVPKRVWSKRPASTPNRSPKATCHGPRPPRWGSRMTPSTSRASRRRASPCGRSAALKDPIPPVLLLGSTCLAAEPRELAQEPVPPSLPHRTAPEGIVGFQVLDGAGHDLVEHR